MSELSHEGFHQQVVPPSSFNAHIFRCPYCREYTTMTSPLSFISLEIIGCGNCSRDFLIENDAAHVLTPQ